MALRIDSMVNHKNIGIEPRLDVEARQFQNVLNRKKLDENSDYMPPPPVNIIEMEPTRSEGGGFMDWWNSYDVQNAGVNDKNGQHQYSVEVHAGEEKTTILNRNGVLIGTFDEDGDFEAGPGWTDKFKLTNYNDDSFTRGRLELENGAKVEVKRGKGDQIAQVDVSGVGGSGVKNNLVSMFAATDDAKGKYASHAPQYDGRPLHIAEREDINDDFSDHGNIAHVLGTVYHP